MVHYFVGLSWFLEGSKMNHHVWRSDGGSLVYGDVAYTAFQPTENSLASQRRPRWSSLLSQPRSRRSTGQRTLSEKFQRGKKASFFKTDVVHQGKPISSISISKVRKCVTTLGKHISHPLVFFMRAWVLWRERKMTSVILACKPSAPLNVNSKEEKPLPILRQRKQKWKRRGPRLRRLDGRR